MKKTILALALISSATTMTAAYASYTVYDVDSTKLDFYGGAQSGLLSPSPNLGDSDDPNLTLNVYGRELLVTKGFNLGLKGETSVRGVDVSAKSEVSIADNKSGKTEFGGVNKAYFSSDFKKYGKITVGKVDSPFQTDLMTPIDISDQWDMRTQGNWYGAVDQQAVYSNTFGALGVQASYQYLTHGYSTSAVYDTGVGLNLRAAYTRRNINDALEPYGDARWKASFYGVGADYTLDNLYLAFVYADFMNERQRWNNKSYFLSSAYTIDQCRLYANYAAEGLGYTDPTEIVKSFKVGVEYNVTPDAIAWLEYRHPISRISNQETVDTELYSVDDMVALTLKYNF